MRPYDLMPGGVICSAFSVVLIHPYAFISKLIKKSDYYLALMPLIWMRLPFVHKYRVYMNDTFVQINNKIIIIIKLEVINSKYINIKI